MKNSNTNHTNVTLNLIQSLFKINELGNGETCQGLLRRFVYKNTNNNEISPHNDMNNKNRNGLINLSTYRLIDFKNVKSLFPYFPISLSFKKKFAFTLAEVLITLGIIGIVAAMTIPTLISNYQKKQTVTKLQKAISILNQAYKLSFDDVGEPTIEESFNMGSEQYFQTYWAPYIKVLTMCSTYNQCGYKKENPWVFANNNVSNTKVVTTDKRATFYTPDGFLYVIFTAMGDKTQPSGFKKNDLVIVDINGHEGPNKFGRDVFFFTRIQTDGAGIQTWGRSYSDSDIDKDCLSNGYYCAEKIRRAGWRIEKDYPW